jgi:hypothetical protein
VKILARTTRDWCAVLPLVATFRKERERTSSIDRNPMLMHYPPTWATGSAVAVGR